MPSFRPSQLRRSVLAALAALIGMALLFGPAAVAGADPLRASAPVLALPPEVTFTLGGPVDSYLLEASGDPVPAIGVDRLPAGLRLTPHGDGSATLAGTPSGPAGTTTVWVRAQNTAGAVVAPLTVVVQQAPAFVDRGPVVFGAGEFGSVTVRTVGYPAPGLGVEGDLPAGLTFTDNGDGTAVIAGTPLDGPASTPVTLTAVNVVADASLTTSIEVVVRPDPSDRPVTTVRPAGPRREP